MSSESLPPDPQPDKPRDAGGPYDGITTYVYDSQNQPASIDAGDGRGPVPASPHPRLFHWEHIPDKRLFALTADGSTEYWRDNPTRFLVVEVDDETGQVKPAVKNRRPVYLSLCREEREGR